MNIFYFSCTIALGKGSAPYINNITYEFISHRKVIEMKLKSLLGGVITSLLLVLLSVNIATANELLKKDYPERYTVVNGDTLWGISGKFLNQPWRWPELWQANEYIQNPHLIYPGDVLVLTWVDGKPQLRALRRETVKLSPNIRDSDLQNAIPPISPAAILPYLSAPLVTDNDEMKGAPYVVSGVEGKLLSGAFDQAYVRGLDEYENGEFRIFRSGRKFVHPETKEVLGLEAIHIGDSRLLKPGDPARIAVQKSFQEVAVLDMLRELEPGSKSLPYFYPRAHDNKEIKGFILHEKNRVTELGPLNVVVITLGERENVEPGHVFKIMSQKETRKDPKTRKTYQIPHEQVGLMMVFRVFDKVSYALITDSIRSINAGDVVIHPDSLLD